jgi:hypothetical protein
MWVVIRKIAIFVAASAAFILCVLQILKDHMGVDTHALLSQLGRDIGTTLVAVQSAFGSFLQWVGSAFTAASAAGPSDDMLVLIQTIATLLSLVSVILSFLSLLNRRDR